MRKKLALVAITSTLFSGCASVPMDSKEASEKAKQFSRPASQNAGIYIYRGGGAGTALKKDIWINDECVGETAPKMFFYKEVDGGKEHELATESEFSPNKIKLKTEAGETYFVKQRLKMGLFVGGAKLEVVDKQEGQKQVAQLDLAKLGTCSK
jgi:hypothetical protein